MSGAGWDGRCACSFCAEATEINGKALIFILNAMYSLNFSRKSNI